MEKLTVEELNALLKFHATSFAFPNVERIAEIAAAIQSRPKPISINEMILNLRSKRDDELFTPDQAR